MSCLIASVDVERKELLASFSVAGLKASLAAEMSSLKASIFAKANMAASADLLQTPIKAAIQIVCTLADVGKYLDVTPADIQWITDDKGVVFDVKSNVEWIIITE